MQVGPACKTPMGVEHGMNLLLLQTVYVKQSTKLSILLTLFVTALSSIRFGLFFCINNHKIRHSMGTDT